MQHSWEVSDLIVLCSQHQQQWTACQCAQALQLIVRYNELLEVRQMLQLGQGGELIVAEVQVAQRGRKDGGRA